MAPYDREKAKLLSSSAYDDDAASFNSGSDDDERSIRGKTSLEIALQDQEVLDSEDEREQLLSRGLPQTGSTSRDKVKISKWERRKLAREAKKDRKQRRKGEDEVMYEMEEGVRPSDSELELSRNSSESDLQRLGHVRKERAVRSYKNSYTIVLTLVRLDGRDY